VTDGRIDVVIVDDHPLVRAGTQALLDESIGINVQGAAEDAAGALQLVREHQPDVLLLDVRLPDMSGIELARQVRATQPSTAILVLTGHDEPGYARALRQIGVRGYLSKTASGEEIVAAVRAVAHGQSTFQGAAASAASDDALDPLTGREQEVLNLLVRGLRNSEIAAALATSVKTAEFHVGRLLQKLRARSRSEAIIRAQELGLVQTPVA
jgi:DNA-binding NarL/FixJ family response regulator